MPTPRLSDCKQVLVVEGYSDLLFYAEVLEWLEKPGVFIKEMGGTGNLTGGAKERDRVLKLETFISPGLLAEKTSIGVIVDADMDPRGAAQSLEARLSKLTGQDVTCGEWTAGSPRIGLYVVPAAERAGEIESLVWEAWSTDPANTAAKACVESFLDCMRRSGHEARSPAKGCIGALLSVLYDEDPRLGPGARARVFDFSRPELGSLVEFLRDI